MRELEQGLRAKKIISHEDIYVLKDYIRKKYPEADIKERAAILANAVHGIIDRHIQEFDEDYRVQIRISLLKKAVSKNHYGIDACDVFKTCLTANSNKDKRTEALARWVNRQQKIPVSTDTLLALSSKVQLQAGELSDEIGSDSSIKGKEVQPVDKFPLDNSFIRGKLFEAGEIPVKVRETALDAGERISRAYFGLMDKLGVRERFFPKVLVASLVVSSVFIFQPLRSILPLSFGSTVKAKEINRLSVSSSLPEDLKYKPVDIIKLKQFLANRDSLLADEPYLMAIIQAAEEFNINPLLLFAIVGQEQSFVPRTDKDARIIANNPFNVYHSWKEYNTNIRDSARIAAITVNNLSENRPEAVDPIFWINRKYAEDKNWWVGVSRIFKELKKEIGER